MTSKTNSGEYLKPGVVPVRYYDDEIVISGIAGRFPDSDNMQHLQDNLFNKVDLVSDDDRRWKKGHPEIPQRTGKINNLEKFDALFFGVQVKQAQTMDPMCRMLMEHAYEAIVDAGMNPRQLRGTKTGVFIGTCLSESEKVLFYEKSQVNGLGIVGCSRSMLANRLSYWLGVHGPSYTVDSACSSSVVAMEHAYRAIRSGECDAALVGGSNLCLHPYLSLQFFRLGAISSDGRCKSFDADADGYARGEAVVLVYLQKAKDAKRIYATYIHGKTNSDGYKEQGITFPSSEMQSSLLQDFYDECGIPPSVVSYVEAHGTGTKVGDPAEVNALEKIFCPGRNTPLRIGSIKSNMGHSEPASGVCAVAKVLIAMETGLLPPNLHYKRPRDGVKALEEGRIKVVSDVTPWDGGYIGINSFGFGGTNAHVLLKSNPKEKLNGGAPNDDLPRLVVISGRTEEAVDHILKDVESRPVDVEYIRLLQDIQSEEIRGHMYRGYTIVGGSATKENPLREIQSFSGTKRPICFVFSGMGSQWPGMGTALLRLPVFAAAIKKCDAVLKPRGIDIYDVLTNKSKSTFDNVLNCFVGIAAVQIGLVDLLTYIGIVPDIIIGHSVGELGCAYADGCFTAEQMILAAHGRGLASNEVETIYGSMAAVGLGYKDIKGLCPPDIDVACHNGPDSSTISGPAESVTAFVASLQARKIFAKEVACGDIAYHSRYIAKAGPKLLTYLREVIPEPKTRSSMWLSTSVRRGEWSTDAARASSAEYHTNNLLNPVLFEETSSLIPNDAVTIEIAPHSLLQAILRRSLKSGVTNIGLTRRDHKDNVEVFLQGLGKIFSVGLQPQISKLFPEVQFPVSRGTPMISPLIKWEHSEDWFVTSYSLHEKMTSGERTVEVTSSDEDYKYMEGHVIDGRNLFPAMGYLCLIWETVGMMRGEPYTEVSVVFENVKFLRATTIPKEGSIQLTLMIHKGTGRFEVVEGGAAVVTGTVRYTEKPSEESMNLPIPNDDDVVEEMASKDFYKELRIRGYHYSDLFCSVKSSKIDGSRGTIAWANNWVAFMENMLQMHIQATDTRDLLVPTEILKLTIDTKAHLNGIPVTADGEKELIVRNYTEYDAIVSGGVEIRGFKASAISRRKAAIEPVSEVYKFVAHCDGAETPLKEFIRLASNIAVKNHHGIKLKSIEAIDDDIPPTLEDLASPYILKDLGDIPLSQPDVNIVASSNPFGEGDLPENITFGEMENLTAKVAAVLVCGRELFTKPKTPTLNQLLLALKAGGFLLTRETGNISDIYAAASLRKLDLVLEKRWKNEFFLLFRKRNKVLKHFSIVKIAANNFEWIPKLQSVMKAELEKPASGINRIILVSDKDYENGLLGLINCLRKEPGAEIVRGYLIQDKNAPEFSKDNPFYASQLQLDLGVNVLRENGVWGTYRHLPLPEVSEKPIFHVWANQLVRGDLNSLRWFEGPLTPTHDKQKLARVAYASINLHDVMLASGKLTNEVIDGNHHLHVCPFGSEYSGVDYSGRRIMGLVKSQGFSNLVLLNENFSWHVPEAWSLEDAATIPYAYTTCYYALYMNGKMKKNNKVLIHAGSGDIGQAAITLALHEGCEVFTTVDTSEKRRFIKERFPQIAEDHIGNSRDTSFEQMIVRQTKGRGVDIVLNSLAEEKLQTSVRCLATGGRFLEIGKFDLAADNPLGMKAFLRGISFFGVTVDNIFIAPLEEKSELHNLLQIGIDSGVVKPLSRTVFPKEELESAFRYITAEKHIGKVIVSIHGRNESLDSPLKALPRFNCLADRSYVIIGGLGGFGLELADWLVRRGARNLVLTSRSGIINGYQLKRTELFKSYGVKVVIISGKDGSKRQDCEYILSTTSQLAPVDGIFNLAVVLKDAIMENQTEANYEESFRGKAWLTKQLDEVSRKLCPLLRHFVVFSTFSCGRGYAGQTNYGTANSAMERICERRVAEGLPALAVQWAAVGDVGIVANMLEVRKEVLIGGTMPQSIVSCLVELDKFLNQSATIVSSMVVAEKRAISATNTVASTVTDTVRNIMSLKDLKSVSTHTSLPELGMDSMMAVEIKDTLEREFGIYLTPEEVRGLNFAKLMEMSSKQTEEKKHSENGVIGGEILTGIKLLVHPVKDMKMAQEVCLELPTKAETERVEVFLIPGIEGDGNIFQNITSEIRSPATCLQLLNTDNSKTSIVDMAQQFLPHVLERTKRRRDFVIVGYSFGSLVAIELARKLEAEGLTGSLILIDGSPELIKSVIEQQLSTSADEELQSNVLLGIMDIIAPSICPELDIALDKCETWSEKLDAFMTLTPTNGAYVAPEEQKSFCTAVFKRLIAVQNYDYTGLSPLRSSITLLKPSSPTLKSVSQDYGLSKVTREKVDMFTIDGNHKTILNNVKIAKAINGELFDDVVVF